MGSDFNAIKIKYSFQKKELFRLYVAKLFLSECNFSRKPQNKTSQEHLSKKLLRDEYFRRLLAKNRSISWIEFINPTATSLIANRYIADYCLDGSIKLPSRINALSYYDLLKKYNKLVCEYPARGLICNKDFLSAFVDASRNFNSPKATYLLRLIDQDLCAGSYKFYKYVAALSVVTLLIYWRCFELFALLACLLSSASCALKTFFIIKAASKLLHRSHIPLEALPIYSILIPLYQEPNRIEFIIKAISRINYPKNRLDVKLVVEEDDLLTQKELNLADLPSHFYVIKVPVSKPRTKPKALNFAAQYISGDYLAIFDAEDDPDPNQLLKSLQKFQNLSSQYVCLQAKLNFYNAHENLLTTMQSLEYSLWFDYLLQGMSNSGQVIPLGGTSCHFKVDILRKLGYWDAFNVTEDLELGIRIYCKGYKTSMLESTTLEEAITTPIAWLKQRARWNKGFMQSYVVFCHNRNKFALKFRQKLVLDLFVGVGMMNFLTPIYFLLGHRYDNLGTTFCVYCNSFLCIMYLLICAYIVTKKEVLINVQDKPHPKILIIIIFPFYFILHTIAAYIAIFQLIANPFRWNKTKHGISKYS